jgi:pimeloyl-ACP methyl ester carboxylesterase
LEKSESVFRKVGKKSLGIFFIILVCIILLLSVLLFKSSGKVAPFLDEYGNVLENSISEKTFVNINGVKQGMFIRGKNVDNPVLLFVHGGPGMPEYFLTEKYKTDLEKHFTVCYWEQRGAGLSYSSELSASDITVSQLVSDTSGVAKYLRDRFEKNKIYLLCHSWGTFIGIQSAAANPELYYAYIGMGQVTDTVKSEKLAYDYMIKQFTAEGNNKMVNNLKKYDILRDKSDVNLYMSSSLRDGAMHKLGIGTMHNMKSVVSGVFLPVMDCSTYTASEKINIWRAKAFLNKSTNLRQEMLDTDIPSKVTELKVPTYFISGIYDYTVNYKLSKEYLNEVKAPIKGFYTLKNSAHSPLFEEPEHFMNIIINDVLPGSVSGAD